MLFRSYLIPQKKASVQRRSNACRNYYFPVFPPLFCYEQPFTYKNRLARGGFFAGSVLAVRDQEKRRATKYCTACAQPNSQKKEARRTQDKARGGFFAGSVLAVRDQEKTPCNEVLHSVFFFFYFLRATTRCIGNPLSTHLRSYSVTIFHSGFPFSWRS